MKRRNVLKVLGAFPFVPNLAVALEESPSPATNQVNAEFQGSNDLSTWTTEQTISDANGQIEFKPSGKYKYYRLYYKPEVTWT